MTDIQIFLLKVTNRWKTYYKLGNPGGHPVIGECSCSFHIGGPLPEKDSQPSVFLPIYATPKNYRGFVATNMTFLLSVLVL